MNIVVNILKKLNLIPAPLVDTQSQLVRARAVLEANDLGVFTALEESAGGLTPEEVGTRVEISTEGAKVLLQALDATGYVKSRHGRYINSRSTRRWIIDPKRGHANNLKLQLNTWDRLSELRETLKTGRPKSDPHQEIVTSHSEEQDVYTRAMRELASFFLPEFIRKVRLPRGARRVLDIGGAHGEYSRALVRKFPEVKATILDLAGPIETARRILDEEGNPEQIELRAGDALQDDLGGDWDAVMMINVVHAFNPEQNQDLFQRIHKALRPGGAFIMVDQFLGLGRLRDVVPSLLSLNFFSIGGRCYTFKEMNQLLTDAGFERIKVRRFTPWRTATMIEAVK